MTLSSSIECCSPHTVSALTGFVTNAQRMEQDYWYMGDRVKLVVKKPGNLARPVGSRQDANLYSRVVLLTRCLELYVS